VNGLCVWAAAAAHALNSLDQTGETAMKTADLERIITLLGKYGEAKFGDEWWPGGPQLRAYLSDGEAEELENYMKAELAVTINRLNEEANNAEAVNV
jgi:hypothetical protein